MTDETKVRRHKEAPRFSKIDRRIWKDAKFRALTPPPPCGRYLWFWLLTTDELTNIPGLIPAGKGAIAEILGWSQRGFDKAFTEIEALGMVKADWEARLIWIPKAIKRNPPESPNVVKSWWRGFDDLPECDLLSEAKTVLRAELFAMGKAYVDALDVAFTKTTAKAMRKPIGKPFDRPSGNQEQEQEQEQDKTSEKSCGPPQTAAAATTTDDPLPLSAPPKEKPLGQRPPHRISQTMAVWDRTFESAIGMPYVRTSGGKEAAAVKRLLAATDEAEFNDAAIESAMVRFHADPFWGSKGLAAFCSNFSEFTRDRPATTGRAGGTKPSLDAAVRHALEAENQRATQGVA